MPRTPFETVLVPLGKIFRNRRASEKNSIRHRHELSTDRQLHLTSSSFAHDDVIPDTHSAIGRGANISPALDWNPVPDGTAQLLLVMEDVDIPLALPGIHTVALFPPSITSFSEGALTTENTAVRFIPDRRGRLGYAGPRPLPGHGPHHDHFHLYALDKAVPAETDLGSLTELLSHIHGHVIARGQLTGTQEG